MVSAVQSSKTHMDIDSASTWHTETLHDLEYLTEMQKWKRLDLQEKLTVQIDVNKKNTYTTTKCYSTCIPKQLELMLENISQEQRKINALN